MATHMPDGEMDDSLTATHPLGRLRVFSPVSVQRAALGKWDFWFFDFSGTWLTEDRVGTVSIVWVLLTRCNTHYSYCCSELRFYSVFASLLILLVFREKKRVLVIYTRLTHWWAMAQWVQLSIRPRVCLTYISEELSSWAAVYADSDDDSVMTDYNYQGSYEPDYFGDLCLSGVYGSRYQGISTHLTTDSNKLMQHWCRDDRCSGVNPYRADKNSHFCCQECKGRYEGFVVSCEMGFEVWRIFA